MTASVKRPQYTIPDASFPPCPILVYLCSLLLPLSSLLFSFSPCTNPAGPLPQPYLAAFCQTNAAVQTTAPSTIDEQRLMQSPRLTQPHKAAQPSLTLRLPASTAVCEVRWGDGKGGEQEKDPKRTHQHPRMHLLIPLPPPPSSPTPLICS